MIKYTKSAEETEAVGALLAEMLDKEGKKRAFIAMRGEMGVGKTAFTRGFASHFGISGVKSPTYTIVNEHRGKVNIFHFDMYRITDGDDLYSTGYDEYVESDGYCIAEWSENIEDFIPDDAIFVRISRCETDADGRKIEIEYEDTCI
ncbi:MAG: tRNA (adenosine(37)-N6)-threonylcarbamoyltransferase complex ATPase subunit type 1 TsaE [Ruminococcaceae bacterium]|nr:tRNA (adenosine(37)-N6)-threonylcarbamoyltransferase complex ATPase subunit type 1 TsaE [Oscillospiraceae bacterium]